MSGFAALDAMIATLAKLEGMAKACAPDISDALEKHLRATIAAGADAFGESWAPKKRGSGKPLAKASQHLYVAPVGEKIVARVVGVEARHHFGAVKGKTRRKILPTSEKLPPALTDAITVAVTKHFRKIVGGGSE